VLAGTELSFAREVKRVQSTFVLIESHLLDPRAACHSREDIAAAIERFLSLARRA
jgi:hypothetical protein